MKKRTFYSELAYVLGLVTLALGVSFMEAAGFGVSMVVAPANLLYLKISQYWPFFTFGMAEYTLQAVLLILMGIALRRFKPAYLLSFVTAVIYGFTLDGAMALVALIPLWGMAGRIAYYVVGMVLCSMGVSLMFHTYFAPEAYELFVKEVSAKTGINIHKFKTGYDIVSCLVAVVMSFAFFGLGVFKGVKWGTILCALVNGWIISRCTRCYEHFFTFKDRWKLRKYFE